MNDLRDSFFQECDELLEGLSSGLNDLETQSGDDETVNALFRSVHSIKGGAGAFGLDRLVSFAHAFENVLDELRSNRLELHENIVALMLVASDHLSDLVDAARDGNDLPAEDGASTMQDLQLLSQSTSEIPDRESEVEGPEFAPVTLDLGGDLPELPDLTLPGKPGEITIQFRVNRQLYANGNDPALLFRALSELGDLSVSCDSSGISTLDDSEGWEPRLEWALKLLPDDGVDISGVREIFEFVEGQCHLEITAAGQPLTLEQPVPVEMGQPASAVQDLAQSVGPNGAPETTKPDDKPAVARSSTIRVDLKRIDRLINLVGELVISEAMLRQSMTEFEHSANSAVDEAMGQLRQLSGILQESVMAIRAQPVRSLFQRMSRIVREAAKESGKSARLVTVGDATEVDKTVTERLVEPLMHMVRNSIDHGLELPQDRLKAGKPERGTVTLEAAHRSGRVIISLSDDGAGINRPKVRQIAEERGMVRPEEDLSDTDIDNLLFRPGFSTADSVSSLSGRGVGMDVVRSEIQALGGRIMLTSTPGEGTKIAISLPLTLAVLEGMVVTVEGEALVVPTLALRETIQPGQADVHAFCDDDRVLTMNGELVPIVDLGAALGYRPLLGDFENQSILLIEGESGRRTALAVDRIVDQREVVIKGLEQNYRPIPGIAAATILGDGRIALIVDTDQMITRPAANLSRIGGQQDHIGVLQHA